MELKESYITDLDILLFIKMFRSPPPHLYLSYCQGTVHLDSTLDVLFAAHGRFLESVVVFYYTMKKANTNLFQGNYAK